MRTVGIAVIAVGAALLGGVAALLLGDATGLTDGDTTTIVAPATETTTSSGPPATAPPLLGNGFNPAAIYAARSAGVVTIYTSFDGGQNAQGSGFVVDGKGTIMTNAHVITNVDPREPLRGADRTFVEFKDGDRAEARIVGWDVFNDVGVIKVDPA
ncbi:MAG TPA: trypsin-like peptidase domain-containing protein, partial [Gaiellaceae bacterium]|nr:trypsin-like peptidase domain-containing protein [Gaiellaceae bacterium]